jgi:probable rRNA maturation factor
VSPSRPIEIQNRHPRLTVPAAAVRRAIALLDAHFRIVPADLPTFSPARRAQLRAAAPARVAQSKIPAPACPPGELSVVFLTDAALAALHAQFLDDPTTTDVITFEGDPLAGLAGEICVSADTAHAYAREHSRDFATELTLYVVHGWLHLAGYDDLRPAKKRRMRAAEARAMQLLTEANAIPAFRRR